MDVGSAFSMLIALAFVVALIIGGAFLVKRFGGPIGASGPFKVLGSASLGGRERVVLLQVGEEQILLGVAPGSVTHLGKPEKNIEVAEVNVFAQTLANSLGRRKT